MTQVLTFFPKFLRDFDVHQLAQVAVNAGLNAVDLVVRDGYWTPPEDLARTLPPFSRVLEQAGISVASAIIGEDAARLAANPEPLAILAENGIPEVRFGWFPRDGRPAREQIAAARAALDRLAPRLEQYPVRALIQLHFGTLIACPSAAWSLLEGRDPRHFGVQLDPGNQVIEGHEDWGYACELLGDFVASVGIKDTRPRLVPEGTRVRIIQDWAPLSQGSIDWIAIAVALKKIGFAGTLDFMPFYHPEDPSALATALIEDVRILREYFGQGEVPLAINQEGPR